MGSSQSAENDESCVARGSVSCSTIFLCGTGGLQSSLPFVGRCGDDLCFPKVKVHPVGRALRSRYDVEEEAFADGGTAKVYLCRRRIAVGAQDPASAVHVCKSIAKSAAESERARITREVDIWTKLLDPTNATDSSAKNIVRLYEVFEEPGFVHLVMEYCAGGELYARQAEVGVFTEDEARVLLRQMISTVAHLHRLAIVHRDLKPENWLLMSPEGDDDGLEPLKLTDFGSSAELQRADGGEPVLLRERVGSPYYVAPEVLEDEGYGCSCDIWGIGVIGYILLSGQPPFDGPDAKGILNAVLDCRLGFGAATWACTTAAARGFIAWLLTRNAERRPDVEAAASHEWFVGRDCRYT